MPQRFSTDFFQCSKRASRLCIVLCLAVLSACGDGGQTEELADVHLQRGERYLADGQFRAANLEAQNAIAKAPDQPGGYAMQARVFNSIGDFLSASKILERVPDSLRNDPGIQLQLLEAYISAGKLRSAAATLGELEAQLAAGAALDRDALALQRALLARARGDAEAAEAIYAELLGEQPDNASVLVASAELALLTDQPAVAETRLGEAATLDADNPTLLLLQGVLHSQRDQLTLAELRLKEALDSLAGEDIVTNEQVAVLVQLESLMKSQGRSVDAMAYREKLDRKGADLVQQRLAEALRMFQGGEFDEAQVMVEGILAEQPGHKTANLVLAAIYTQSNRYEEAADLFDRHIDFELNSPELVELAVQAHLRAGRSAKLLERLEAYRGLREDARMLNAYARALAEADRQAPAIEALERSLQADSRYIPSYLLLDAFYQSTERPAADSVELLSSGLAALQEIEHAPSAYLGMSKAYIAALYRADQQSQAQDYVLAEIESSNASAEALHVAAAHALLRKDYGKAQTYAEASLEKDPSDASLWTALAGIEQELGKPFDSVLQAASKAVEIQPSQVQGYRRLLAFADQPEQLTQVVARIEAIAEQSGEAVGLAVLSTFFLSTDELDKASDYLQQFRTARSDPDAGSGLQQRIELKRAIAKVADGDSEEARQLLEQSLEKNPESPQLLSYLIRLETSESNYTVAHQLAERLIQLEPVVGLAHDAEVFRAESRHDQAIARYREAWSLAPNNQLAVQIYRQLELHQSDQVAAFIEEWDKALPGNTERLQVLSSRALQLADFPRAIEINEQLLMLEPDNSVALNNLAWLYHNAGDTRAFATAEKAYQLAPENVQVIDTYATVLAANGQLEKAVELFELALSKAPEDATIQENLAAAKAQL